MPQAFIIHSPADDAQATVVRNALATEGIDAWVDHVDCEGDRGDWARQAVESRETAGCGIFVLTAQSAAASPCRGEALDMLEANKAVYVLSFEPVQLENFPESFLVQYIDLTQNRSANWSRLVRWLKSGSDGTATSAAPVDLSSHYITGPFPRWLLHHALVGRGQELQAVQRALADGQRVTSILGLSGVGKTRLAVEVVRNANFRHGVIWHTLRDFTSVQDLAMLVRNHLRLDANASADAVWAELSRRQVLIVLDNGEEVGSQRAAYTNRLNNLDLSGGTRILMTSRQRWPDVRDQKAIDLRVPELGVATSIVRAMMRRSPPSYDVHGHEEAIARAAHCRPKLIEYALRWADSYPPSYVIEILSTLRGDDAEEAFDDMVHKTVRLAEQHPDWPRAYAALRKLAVCQGSFTFAAARALIGEPRPLSLLKDWGLVTLENLRYTIDPLLSVHVELDDSAGLTHFSYFLAFAEDADSRQDYQGMEAEFPNLVTAFDWALANNELESALNLANACSSFMSNRGMLEQRRNWYERIAAKLPTTADETPQDYLQASVQIGLGVSYYESLRGDRKVNLVRAVNAFGRALRFFNPQRYPSEYALIQNNLGTTFRMLAEVEEPTKNLNLAISAFERAGRFFTREESPLDFGVIQNNLGATYLNLAGLENRKDNLRRAISAFRRALVYIKPENQPLHYALIHNNLGIAYADMAEVESQDRRTENIKKAISAFDRAGRFLTPQRAPMHHARLFTNLGHTHRNLAEIYGEPDKLRTAIAAYTRALSIWTAARAPMLHAQLQSSMGFACLDLSAMEDEQSNLRKAEDAFKQAIAVYSPRLNQSDRIRLTVLLGIVYRRLGQIRESIACWREAENYFRQINQTDMADRMARYISGESDPPVPPNPAKWVAWQ